MKKFTEKIYYRQGLIFLLASIFISIQLINIYSIFIPNKVNAETNKVYISDCQQLQSIGNSINSLSLEYILNNDINCANATREGGALWNSGSGFMPIGNRLSGFTGTFDGNNKTINGVYINRGERYTVGLFGHNSGTIKNLRIINADIKGGFRTGILSGINDGTVTRVSTAGNVVNTLNENAQDPIFDDAVSADANFWNYFDNGIRVRVYFFHWTATISGEINLAEPGNYDYMPAVVFLASDAPGLDGNWAGVPVALGSSGSKMPSFTAVEGTEYVIALVGGRCSSSGRTIDLSPFLASLNNASGPSSHTFDGDGGCETGNDLTSAENSSEYDVVASGGGLVGTNSSIITDSTSSANVNKATSESQISPKMPSFTAVEGTEYVIALTGGNCSSNGRTIDLTPFLASLNNASGPSSHTFDGTLGNCAEGSDLTEGGDNFWNNFMNGDNPVHVYYFHWTSTISGTIQLAEPGNYDYFPAAVFLGSDYPDLSGAWQGSPVELGEFDNTGGGSVPFGAAGLVGLQINGSISDSYATGNVGGGFVSSGFANIASGTINRSYSLGHVSGTTYQSGFAMAFIPNLVTSSFWDITASGIQESVEGTGKNTTEMKNITTYTSLNTQGLSEPWDFVNNPNDDNNNLDTWLIDPDLNEGYPCLSWQGALCGDNSYTSSSSDSDPIPDSVEDAAPGNGDGNNDGTPDSQQSNVSSLASTDGTYVTLALPEGTTISSTTVDALASMSSKDIAYAYPLGLASFTVTTTNGAIVPIELYFHTITKANAFTPRKYNNNTKTYSTLSSLTTTNLTDVYIGTKNTHAVKLTYGITDGGPLDQDNTVNGTIVDPVGLAQASVGVPNSGLGGKR